MRGAASRLHSVDSLLRITPACAGSRRGCSVSVCLSEDHPRVCGEQLAYMKHERPFIGSPPRVRGAVSITKLIFCNKRITPACAGSRTFWAFFVVWAADHPRVCGEQYTVMVGAQRPQGSPPRVRGAASGACQGFFRMRITPACAGSSL